MKNVQIKKEKAAKRGISWKFQTLSIGCFVVIVVIILMTGSFMFGRVADGVSSDYANFYSRDAVNRLNVHLYHEIELTEKLASSDKVVDWFHDEGDIAKKTAAVDEMLAVGDLFYSDELYFVIDESLNEYSIDLTSGASLKDFEPFDVILDEASEDYDKWLYDRWYFNAINSENNYALNIDTDKVTGEHRLWINHKVMRGGTPVGVFCSGLLFDELWSNLYAGYDPSEVRSVILNEDGIIQMDSAIPAYEHLPTFRESMDIGEISSDPAFTLAVQQFLGKTDGFFTEADEPLIVALGENGVQYAAIAPIANTNWVEVTFFNPESLFNAASFWPLLFIVIIALVAYGIFIMIISRRLIFTPFRKLLGSFGHIGIADGGNSHTDSMANEFGEVFKMIEYTRLVTDAMPMSCILWDAHFDIIDCNVAALSLYEMGDKDELNARFFELSPEYQQCGTSSRILRDEYLQRAFDEGYLRIEWMHHTLGGEPLPCEIIFVRLKHRDEYVVATYSRDLREHKKYLEEINNTQSDLFRALDIADRASHAKSRFLANVSHEIMTPLNSIVGFSELAIDERKLPKVREYLDKILKNSQWLLGVVKNLLDISEIDSDKMELERTPFDIHDVLRGCREEFSPRAAEKGLDLQCSIEVPHGIKLLGDSKRLRQAIGNLLSNAVKFTSSGFIKFSVVAGSTAGHTVTVYFEVKDTGIGMSEQEVAGIFEPFMQADNSSTRKFGGTGLGLAIAKNIIEMMGGELEVESAPDAGSSFNFDLTFDKAEGGGVSLDDERRAGTRTAPTEVGEGSLRAGRGAASVSSGGDVAGSSAGGGVSLDDDEEFEQDLTATFIEVNKTKYEDIQKALSDGDIKLAHRLAHTLKGNAALLKLPALQKAAKDVEDLLRDGENKVTEDKLDALGSELETVLKKLAPLTEAVSDSPKGSSKGDGAGTADAASLTRLFAELEAFLDAGNPECLKLVGALREIPGSEKLIHYMEDYEFADALEVLGELKGSL